MNLQTSSFCKLNVNELFEFLATHSFPKANISKYIRPVCSSHPLARKISRLHDSQEIINSWSCNDHC